MTTNLKLALAVLIGVSIGIAGARSMRAQQASTPPGYVIAEEEITDLAGIEKYAARIPETLAPFNHHYVVRSSKIQTLEGDPPKSGVVIIAFDSVDKAREWYDSPAYKAIRGIRQGATKSRLFLVEGEAVP